MIAASVAMVIDTGTSARAAAPTPIYQNPLYSPAERAADLISRMTPDEKAAQLSTTNAPAIPRLGVQEYAYWSEALHGVNAFWGGDYTNPSGVDVNSVRATSFPSSLSASLTWDPTLIRQETSDISDEARGFLDPSLYGNSQNDLGPSPSDYGSLFYFAPTVNMDRDPRWGRADESFGEDPFLTGTLGTAWVEGFQGENPSGQLQGRYLKAVTTLKHYALNNVENDRMGLSSDTSEATIRDYYTRQFRQIIQSGHATGVMSSYNAINGVPAVANNLTLNVLLRRTFGFGGYVTSDCGAVGTIYRDDNPTAKNPPNPAVAAFITSGHDWTPAGWTSNHGDEASLWTETGSPLTTISGRSGAEAWSLRTGTGLNCVGFNGEVGHPAFWDPLRPLFSDENRVQYVDQAISAQILSEGVIDRELLPVFTQRMRTGEFDPRSQQAYTRINKSTIQSPAHQSLTQTVGDEALTLLQNNRPAGSRQPLLPVDAAAAKRVVVVGDQANQVFLGDYSGQPSEQVSVLDGIRRALPGAQVVYDSGQSSDTSTQPPSLAPSTQAAIKTADLVVVMVGTDANVNTEGYDRKSLELPGNYEQLIDQVTALGNPRVLLLDQSAGPVDLTRVRSRVASILFSAANGERQGLAAADVIFGKTNPSGHLSFTWYANDGQLPDKNDYNLAPAGTGGLGRTYMYFTGRPTYPFGYGLSYTTFRYSGASLPGVRRSSVGSSSPGRAPAFTAAAGGPVDGTLPAGATLRVSFRVTNTGRRTGATVAQLYATPPHPGGDVPGEQLAGFARTRVLAPGKSQQLTISVPVASALRRWSPAAGREVVSPGIWRFRLGRSSRDFVRTFRVRITGSIPRTISTVTVAPPTLALSPGEKLDLRGRNPWLDGLAPAQYQGVGDTIISAVRRDDSFVDLTHVQMQFRSNRPGVVSVDRAGIVRAVSPGVATISVTIGGVTASTPFVVSSSSPSGLVPGLPIPPVPPLPSSLATDRAHRTR